ncbi:MAG TPA: glycosyltransferase [Pyrinomonadaceae bacterium]|jgi:glycosyltransferase involved in cell wall biosynthesis
MPEVSVIIPTHSRPRQLPRAVESARSAGEDVEVVVVDDASSDETADVCRKLEGIRYVRVERNQGVAGARNVGLLSSTGDFVSFLDDDDVRLPGSLGAQLAVLRAAPEAGLVYGQALYDVGADRSGSDRYPQSCPRGDLFWRLLARNFIPCGSVVFRRACLFSVGLLDCSAAGVDDWDLWVRIAALYPSEALERPVVVWRRPAPGSDQGSARAVEMVELSTRQFQRRWLKLPRAAGADARQRREATRQFSKNMASHLAFEAARSLAYGHFLRAERCALAALRLHPRGLVLRALEGFTSGRTKCRT